MCGGTKGCQKPENLKGTPEGCSPEQIRKCHGDVECHPCVDVAGCEHPEKLKGRKVLPPQTVVDRVVSNSCREGYGPFRGAVKLLA
jgi:hypothetical protein